MKVTSSGILLSGVGLGAIYLLTRERNGIFRPVTPDATKAYWASSFGDLTLSAMDWATNGWGTWGDNWDWNYNGNSKTIDDVQGYYENGGFSSL
jgi:hypothetical protein